MNPAAAPGLIETTGGDHHPSLPAGGGGRRGRPWSEAAENPSDPAQTVRLEPVALDGFTTQLVAWVAGGCTDAGWAALLERRSEPGCPPWLDPGFVSLDDLSHRVLAVALAFLVHQQGAVDPSPFAKEPVLTGASLLRRLSLPAPSGVCRLSECLAWNRNLRRRGWIELDNEWSVRRLRKGLEPLSVNRFLKMEISLPVSMLGPLLGLPDLQEEAEGPALEDLTLPEAVWQAIDGIFRGTYPADIPRWIYLKGPEHSGRRSLAKALAREMGRKLKIMGPGDGACPGAFLLVDIHRTFDEDDWARVRRHTSWVFLRSEDGRDPLDVEGRANLVLDLGDLDQDTRSRFWTEQIEKAGSRFSACTPLDVSGFSAPPGAILQALRRTAEEAELKDLGPSEVRSRLLDRLARDREVDEDASFGEPTAPKRAFHELCLSPEGSRRFQQIVASIRGRQTMMQRWNLDPSLVGQAQGIALFHGPSGTGKSMAAEVLAAELGLPLLRVEATALEGPYVGESERLVTEFFRQAGREPSVLLLDEADSFLMDRSRTEGSTRRYQNALVNCWLRELDRFTGILMMTSNHAEGMDPALERRIQFRMAFEAPSQEVRERIWRSCFDRASIPGTEGLDLQEIAARFNLSGGRIRNAFLGACHRAAELDAISQAVLIEACEEELRASMPSEARRTIRGFAFP